jgi:hypothetical protein
VTSRDSEPSSPPEGEENVHGVDTVPPPESGDAYSAMTVVREAPPAVLEAIRKRKLEEAVKKADAAQEKKATERSVELTGEMGSGTASEKLQDTKPPGVDTAPPGSDKPHPSDEPKKSEEPEEQEELAPLSPPASALAPAPLPRIEGYGVPRTNGVDDDDQDESGLSIRPNVPASAKKEEHADASILAIEASADGKSLNMAAPFAPAPRRMSENVTLAVIVVIALAAGWILSALFSR